MRGWLTDIAVAVVIAAGVTVIALAQTPSGIDPREWGEPTYWFAGVLTVVSLVSARVARFTTGLRRVTSGTQTDS